MQFLYFLESIRTPVGDALMSLITHLGEESFFLVIALLFFWCIDKKRGYFLLTVNFLGIVINQFLKLLFRIPRPWVLDPEFSIVESARAEAGGYSFPSGHTQTSAGTLGAVARTSHRTAVRWVCVVLIVLVALSRMYLGVHTPADVLTSLVIATILIFAFYPLMEKAFSRPALMWGVLGVLVLMSVGFALFVELYPFPADIDPHNLASGEKNAYTMLGCIAAMLVVYAIDSHLLHFSTEGTLIAQIFKLALGAGLAVVIKALLKAPLLALCGGHGVAHGLRYFLVVVFAGVLWPMTFPFWCRVGEAITRRLPHRS